MTATSTQVPALTLHRADCGCVGFRTSEFYMLVLEPCDGDGANGYTFELREMRGKLMEPVEASAARWIVSELQGLLTDGYRLREVQALLRERPGRC